MVSRMGRGSTARIWQVLCQQFAETYWYPTRALGVQVRSVKGRCDPVILYGQRLSVRIDVAMWPVSTYNYIHYRTAHQHLRQFLLSRLGDVTVRDYHMYPSSFGAARDGAGVVTLVHAVWCAPDIPPPLVKEGCDGP
jgi:hypothetical protein